MLTLRHRQPGQEAQGVCVGILLSFAIEPRQEIRLGGQGHAPVELTDPQTTILQPKLPTVCSTDVYDTYGGAPAILVIDEVSLRGEPSAVANVSPLCRVCLHYESTIIDLAHLNVGRASSYYV